jgi:hypothetical protein
MMLLRMNLFVLFQVLGPFERFFANLNYRLDGVMQGKDTLPRKHGA